MAGKMRGLRIFDRLCPVADEKWRNQPEQFDRFTGFRCRFVAR
jgi:hypothetical protein